jgi:hypothetical protein
MTLHDLPPNFNCFEIDLMHNDVTRLDAGEDWKSAFSSHPAGKISIVAILNCSIFPDDDY